MFLLIREAGGELLWGSLLDVSQIRIKQLVKGDQKPESGNGEREERKVEKRMFLSFPPYCYFSGE